MMGEIGDFFRKPLDPIKGLFDDKKTKEEKKAMEKQEMESIRIVENSVKEKYKSISQFDKLINETRSSIKFNSKPGRLLYYKILKNLDADPQIIKGGILNVISEIFNIVDANRTGENSKQINEIKEKLTKFKNNLKEFKELLGENLYQKLKQFSVSYDRSLINKYFTPFQISTIETKLKHSKDPQKMEYGLRSLAHHRANSKVFSFNEEQISNLLGASEEISTQNDAQQSVKGIVQEVTQQTFIKVGQLAVDVATKISNNNQQQNDQVNTNGSLQNKSDSSVKSKQNEPSQQQNNQIFDDKNQHNEDKKEDVLDDKENVSLENYLLRWEKYDNEKSCEGTPLKHAFILIHKDWLKGKTLSPEELDKKYLNWKNSRLKDIKKLFNKDDIGNYARRKQIIQLNGLDTEETGTVLGNMSDSKQSFDNDVDAEIESLKKFSCYTSGEILGELLLNIDNDPDGFKLLQIFASSTAHGQKLFDEGHITGEWNDETQFLLQNALNDPIFSKADANANGNYSKKINEILKKHEPLKDVSYLEKHFQSLSEVQKRETAYWEDPEGYWKSQTIEGPREFVGIRDNTLGGLWDSYKEGEKDFIQNNMKGFNKKIEDFLTLPKLQEGETPNAETKAKMDQIWNAIPIEQLNSIYEKFASNPEEQKKFEEFLKNNNLPSIDLQDNSLKNFVVKKNLSLNPAAEYCYQRLWTCLQEQITGEAGKTLQYLSDKTGDTAFNIKNKVLEFFLPGISIHPENSEDGIFYFRDENNLDTLYGFNPEDGKIFQKGNISLGEDDIIKFGASEAEGNLLKQIHGFQDMISFELGDILPNKNADSVDELEKQITKKIESKINVESVVDTSVVSQALLKKENEKNVCRDRIVGDIKYLLDIERSELHSGDGEKYKIFRSLVKTFEKIKVENPNDNTPLVIMKDFLDKVYSSASQGSLLKPSNNGENIEGKGDDNFPQEGENGSVENQPQEMWKTILLKNLIDPQTQLFDISLITTLNQDKEINDFLAKRDFNNVIGKIAKRKDLQELDKDTNNQISQLTEKTSEELRGLYEETQLLASIDALETQGDFLS